jgi:hypothetical protein
MRHLHKLVIAFVIVISTIPLSGCGDSNGVSTLTSDSDIATTPTAEEVTPDARSAGGVYMQTCGHYTSVDNLDDCIYELHSANGRSKVYEELWSALGSCMSLEEGSDEWYKTWSQMSYDARQVELEAMHRPEFRGYFGVGSDKTMEKLILYAKALDAGDAAIFDFYKTKMSEYGCQD